MNTDVLSVLPNVLRTMMRQLLHNYNIQGWNIFPNKREQICLTIRFDSLEGGHVDSLPRPDSVVYRKVSPRQQTRAKLRLDKHKAINPNTAKVNQDNDIDQSSSPILSTVSNKKRKYDNVTPELIRINNDSPADIKSNTCIIDSPEPVVCVSNCHLDIRAHITESPEALAWVTQPVCDNDQLSIEVNPEPITTGRLYVLSCHSESLIHSNSI